MNKKDMKTIYLRRLVALIRKGTDRTPEENFEISRLRQKLALIDFKANKPYHDKKDLKNQRTNGGNEQQTIRSSLYGLIPPFREQPK